MTKNKSFSTTASEAEAAHQMSMYDGEENTWNWEKYVSWQVKYHVILKNLKEYGYENLDPWTKIHHLLNGIKCDELSSAIATVRSHADKYEKSFDEVVALITQCIEN